MSELTITPVEKYLVRKIVGYTKHQVTGSLKQPLSLENYRRQTHGIDKLLWSIKNFISTRPVATTYNEGAIQ
jgi:hypothetical protein